MRKLTLHHLDITAVRDAARDTEASAEVKDLREQGIEFMAFEQTAEAFQNLAEQGLFKTAATIEVCDSRALECVFEDVFRSTQNIDVSWSDDGPIPITIGGEVEIHPATGENRSTSMGDIIVDQGDGSAYVCARVGWERIGQAPASMRTPGDTPEADRGMNF